MPKPSSAGAIHHQGRRTRPLFSSTVPNFLFAPASPFSLSLFLSLSLSRSNLSVIEMPSRSTLDCIRWSGNWLRREEKEEEEGEEKKKEWRTERRGKTDGKSLSTDSWGCVVRRGWAAPPRQRIYLTLTIGVRSIFQNALPLPLCLSLAGYKKNCLCTVSTKQMGFCSLDFNTVTVSASVTVTDCTTILMLWIDPAVFSSSCVYTVCTRMCVCVCWDYHDGLTSGFVSSSMGSRGVSSASGCKR